MLKLIRTCEACPEQYDAIDENGKTVGYLRLRHGTFRVECPHCGGLEVYTANPKGDGEFFDDERDYYLKFAVSAIEKWIRSEFPKTLPEPPDVSYILEDEWKE